MKKEKKLKESEDEEVIEETIDNVDESDKEQYVSVKPLFTFEVDLGFGNKYSFVKESVLKMKKDDFDLINNKFVGMLELLE